MINHIVLFKLKPYGSDNEKQAAVRSIKEALLSLPPKIKELKHLEVGANYEINAKSFDVCLISHFDTTEALDAYKVHPEHVKVAELINQHAVDRAAVDFEF
jgi:hypothetical protein